MVLLCFFAEQLLGLWVVDQDLSQVLLIQDEQVGKSVCLHVGSAAVSSASCQQTGNQRQGTAVSHVTTSISGCGSRYAAVGQLRTWLHISKHICGFFLISDSLYQPHFFRLFFLFIEKST